jgi:20S proteasome alpha/beta subunit
MEAISHAGTVLAVASKEGIAMAAEKVSQLSPTREYKLNVTESYWKAP